MVIPLLYTPAPHFAELGLAMAAVQPDTQTNGRLEPYGNLVDLYAARAMRARAILIADPAPLKVIAIGRGATNESVRAHAARTSQAPQRFRAALNSAKATLPLGPTHPKPAS